MPTAFTAPMSPLLSISCLVAQWLCEIRSGFLYIKFIALAGFLLFCSSNVRMRWMEFSFLVYKPFVGAGDS